MAVSGIPSATRPAASADRVVEAIESTTRGRFILGVQWHPERETGDLARALFGGLVAAALKRRKGEAR